MIPTWTCIVMVSSKLVKSVSLKTFFKLMTSLYFFNSLHYFKHMQWRYLFWNEWQVNGYCTDVQIIGSRLLRVSLLPSVFVFKSYTSGRVDFHCGASTSDVTLQLWQTVLLFPLPPQRFALSPHSSQSLSSRHCSICICLHTLDTLQYFVDDFLSLSKIRNITSAHTLC